MKLETITKLENLTARLRRSALFALLMIALAVFLLSRFGSLIHPDVPATATAAEYDHAAGVALLQLAWTAVVWLVLVQIYIDEPYTGDADVATLFVWMALIMGGVAIVATVSFYRQPLSAVLGFHIGNVSVKLLLQALLFVSVVAWAIYRDFFAAKKRRAMQTKTGQSQPE